MMLIRHGTGSDWDMGSCFSVESWKAFDRNWMLQQDDAHGRGDLGEDCVAQAADR